MHFSKDFFEEEVRADFTISPMMKRAWAAALEILEVVLDICHRHDLHCFAAGGTLLGAIRHQGFIPWDDDIDMMLLREDYNKLIHYLRLELPDGFVISGMHADSPRLRQAALHVPHLRVIADEEHWNLASYMTRFHGFPYFRIGIDIFPLDYMSADQDFCELQFKTCHTIMFTIQNWELYIKEGLLEDQLKEIERVCEATIDREADVINQLWHLYDQVASFVSRDESCGEVTHMQFASGGQPPYHGRPLELYTSFTTLPFESMQMPVPKDYIRAVKLLFGDNYMTPIRFGAAHDYPFYKNQEIALQAMFDADGIETSIEDFCRNWQKAMGEI